MLRTLGTKEALLPKMSFGWELEATRHINDHVPGIEATHDSSVNGEHLEYRVKRSLVFDPDKSLAALRKVATDPGLEIDKSCGFHVHLGMVNRTRRLHAWAAWFVQLARDVEDEAFRAVPFSRTENRFCRSWKESPESIITYKYAEHKYENRDRYNWVNPTEIFRPGGIRTVEIRLMGNTKRYTQLLAWASACRIMGYSAWALISDPSRLEYERNEIRHVFRMIRATYIDNTTERKESSRLALFLAAKAQFYAPFGKPLEALAAKEKRFKPEGFFVGDTVQCIKIDPDRGVRLGAYYTVVDSNLTHTTGYVTIRLDTGIRWNVPISCVRLYERDGELCAV